MKLQELPGVRRILLDLMEASPGLLACVERHSGIDSLRTSAREVSARTFPREHFARLLESQLSRFGDGHAAARNIQRLRQSDTVLIWTSCRGDFAGGQLYQFLECLTAAKLAVELDRDGIPAVPVCSIYSVPSSGSRAVSLKMLDSEGHVRALEFMARAADATPPIEIILHDLQSLSDAEQASETLDLLRNSYPPGTDWTVGTGKLLSALFANWGLVVLDARDRDWSEFMRQSAPGQFDSADLSSMLRLQETRLSQLGYDREEGDEDQGASDPWRSITPVLMESILPVAARVADETNIRNLALLQPVLSQLGLAAPKLWPRASATLIDTRNRKILEKYRIQFGDLFKGVEEVLRESGLDGAAEDAARLWQGLASSIESCAAELQALLPEGESLRDIVADSRGRMLYQVDKLKERYTAARHMRRDVMYRQIGRARNALAPAGCPQESMLAGLYFILRHSPHVLRILFDKLESTSVEHQLLFLE